MHPVEIKKDIFWVGVVDWSIRDFHGYSTYKGTTYNSYLVKDEKITLFDTVKKGFELELIHRLHNVGVKPEDVDYLVINHVEMDHSGGLTYLMERLNPEKVFCSPMAAKALKAHYHEAVDDWPIEVVKSGASISLGKRTVKFLETRMVHWPDSMFSYLAEDKVLISSDAFGHHWATSERFDDEVDQAELMDHCAKYYGNILWLFSPLIQKLLKEVGEMNLEIDVICPDHGVMWRGSPGKIIAAYDRWSKQETVEKAVVVYNTMWHSTEMMAKTVADAIMDQGVSVNLMDLKYTHRSDVVNEMLEAKAFVFGSATLNNGMLPLMADLLHYLRGLKPAGRIAAAFGSYGWSGEAVKLITQQLQDMKLEVLDGVRINYVPDHDSLKQARELGEKIGKAVKAG